MHPCLSDACRKFWKISTDAAAAAAAAECHCTVSGGLAGLCCTCFDKRSCLWGGMRGCSYLASYDELLYICVHTPSISPTPTIGGTLILADGFHLRLCILLSISNVILSHLNLRAGSADSPHLLWKRRSCGTTALPLLYFQQCHFTFSAFRLVGEA